MRIADVVATTDTGRKRRRNEDAYVCKPPLFAVADGMGGPRAGEVASSLAAAAVKGAAAGGAGVERVVSLIQAANRSVYERSSEDENVSGMGTTMTVALVDDGGVAFGHVGDSRGYLARDGVLEQLTEDHSLVAELVRGGKISPEEAVHHPQRSVITRAVGTDPDVDVDTFTVVPQPGDVFLLCSDGLTTMISDETILRVVEEHRGQLEHAAKELVKLANRAGGEDNITIVAFEMTDEPEERTVEQTLPGPTATNADDEDTLDELDAVPVLEEPRKRRRKWPWFLLLLLIVAAAIAVWVVTR